MQFDTVTNAPCIPGTGGTGSNGSGGSGGGGSPTDPRCSDAAFAAANPSVCGSSGYIILKPANSIISVLGSVQLNVFLYQNGVETEIASGVLFGASDPTVFVVGASSGNGTGLSSGQVVVTANYNGMTATADVTVVSAAIGCSETPVATAILVDNSTSMSQAFGGSYKSRLAFAQAIATAYSAVVVQVNGKPKDSLSVFSFNDTPTQISNGFISDPVLLASQISSIYQSQGDTDLSAAIASAVAALQATSAAEQVILLISDGEQTDAPTEQDVLTAASAFTAAGGIIICIGCRASASGFDLLDRAATGGFFINALPSNAADVAGNLSYLKSLICTGACVMAGDYYSATGESDYSSFLNWSVVAGQVNLLGNGFEDFLPGNGLYVQLAENNKPATIETIDTFLLSPGDSYQISFSLGGNNELYTPDASQTVQVFVVDVNSGQDVFQHTVAVDWNAGFQTFTFSFTAQYAATVRLGFVQQVAVGFTGNFAGNLLDNITFSDASTLVNLLFDDFNDENLKYIPPACGPSAALAALANPSTPALSFINYEGGSQLTGETYKYAVSCQTLQGETALSPVASTASLAPVTMSMQATLLSGIGTSAYPPDRITAIRIWRNDVSASSTLYLLATLTPESINYIDTLDHAQFAAIVNGAITPPVSNTTAVAAGALGIGSLGCYEAPCETDIAISAQIPDPNPLPNIEVSTGGGGGNNQFTSTQQVCLPCLGGGVVVGSSSTLYTGTTTVAAGTITLAHQFTTPVAVERWSITSGALVTPNQITLNASNDGINWTQIAQGSNLTAGINSTAAVPYSFWQLVITGQSLTSIAYTILGGTLSSSGTICKSATATGVSQQAADNAAIAAATQAVNLAIPSQCFPSWTTTVTVNASCPCGQLGQTQTITVTYTSLISMQDATTQATAVANAQANLVCTQSNNTQQIVFTGNAGTTAGAPYPTVQYVSQAGTVNQVVVNVNGLQFETPSQISLLLVSPSGRCCMLMQGCQSGSNMGSWYNGSPNPNPLGLYIVFTDSATDTLQAIGSTTTQGNPIVGSGASQVGPTHPITVKPYAALSSSQLSFTGCAQKIISALGATVPTSLSTFIGDTAAGSWSLWAIQIGGDGYAGAILSGWSLTIT